jgi:hypothetical protein
MHEEVANVLILCFVIVPIVLLVYWLMSVLGLSWTIQNLLISLPF